MTPQEALALMKEAVSINEEDRPKIAAIFDSARLAQQDEWLEALRLCVKEMEAWEILRKRGWTTLDLHDGLWAIADEVENWICRGGARLTETDPVEAVHAADKWMKENQ